MLTKIDDQKYLESNRNNENTPLNRLKPSDIIDKCKLPLIDVQNSTKTPVKVMFQY